MAMLGKGILERLISIVPKGTRRVIIDIEVGEAIRVYYDTFGNNKILDTGLLADIINEAEIAERK